MCVLQSLRKVGQDPTVLLICITVFLSYLPEAGQYSSFFLYLRQVRHTVSTRRNNINAAVTTTAFQSHFVLNSNILHQLMDVNNIIHFNYIYSDIYNALIN